MGPTLLIRVILASLLLLILLKAYFPLGLDPPLPAEDGGDATSGSPCDVGWVDLQSLADSDLGTDDGQEHLFLLEMLRPRVSCAIESAVSAANLSSVVLATRAPGLDLRDRVTCAVYEAAVSRGGPVLFRRLVPALDFRDTPLYELQERNAFQNSKYFSVHLSDALRLAILYKYGGWYADTDTIFLRSLSDKPNILAATASRRELEERNEFHLTNYIIHMEKRHPLLEKYMENFRSEFRGEIRSEAGPWLLTMTLMDLCGVPEAAATSYNNIPGKVFSGIPDVESCHGLVIKHPETFHPFRPYQEKEMFPPGGVSSVREWEEKVGNAWVIHFFNRFSSRMNVSGNPLMDVYSYYAPKYCPQSYGSTDYF